MKKRKWLLLGCLIVLGIGFALVTTTLYINGNVNIEANTEDFDVVFTKAVVDSEDKTSTAISADGKAITYTTKELEELNDKSVLDFEITNNSYLYDAEVSIECSSGEKREYYQITKEVSPTILAKTTEAGKVEVEKIKIAPEDIEETFTCTVTATAKERTTKGEEPVKINTNIVNSDLECLKNKEAGSCASGTEIRYMVNDTIEKTFNILHDDGATLTLQQRENTINATPWYRDEKINNKGPLTIIPALENATSDWSNVNTIEYTMGTTIFNGTNAYTGCDSNLICDTNTYTLGTRNSTVRMITVQEATELGCTTTDGSCPEWMQNYSDDTTKNEENLGGGDYGYWTMSSNYSIATSSWYIRYSGYLDFGGVNTIALGGRAVVEINKYA